MITGVADTHTLIWYLFGDRRLSSTARAFIEEAASGNNQIGISTLTLVEIVYLAEKGRIAEETFARLIEWLDRPESVLLEIPLDRQIAATLARVERGKVPDMSDRIIAATAVYLNVPIISRDGKIQLSGLKTIW